MKKRLVLLPLLALLVLSGCLTGPSYLSRSVDDMMNNQYKDSPLGTALLADVIPVYPLIKGLAWIPDILILNPVQFWASDIWQGEGAAFVHDNPFGARDPWFK